MVEPHSLLAGDRRGLWPDQPAVHERADVVRGRLAGVPGGQHMQDRLEPEVAPDDGGALEARALAVAEPIQARGEEALHGPWDRPLAVPGGILVAHREQL